MQQELIGILLSKKDNIIEKGDIVKRYSDGALLLSSNGNNTPKDNPEWEPLNLYICDPKAPIIEGDWYIDTTDNSVSNCFIDAVKDKNKCYKIIATNNRPHGLPSISDPFLESYVKVQGKGKIMMESAKDRYKCTGFCQIPGTLIGGYKDMEYDSCMGTEGRNYCNKIHKAGIKLDSNGCVELSIVPADTAEEMVDRIMSEPSLGLHEETLIEELRQPDKPQTVEEAARKYIGIYNGINLDTYCKQIDTFGAGATFGANCQKEQYIQTIKDNPVSVLLINALKYLTNDELQRLHQQIGDRLPEQSDKKATEPLNKARSYTSEAIKRFTDRRDPARMKIVEEQMKQEIIKEGATKWMKENGSYADTLKGFEAGVAWALENLINSDETRKDKE